MPHIRKSEVLVFVFVVFFCLHYYKIFDLEKLQKNDLTATFPDEFETTTIDDDEYDDDEESDQRGNAYIAELRQEQTLSSTTELNPTTDLDETTDFNPTTDLNPSDSLNPILDSAISAQKNVLFMMTDDMRPQLGSYNGDDFPMPYNKHMKMYTPNLDALAAKSILFKRAYTQYSLCGPSRTSMLTSRRPDTTRIFSNHNYWRKIGGNFTTLPQYFKNEGYKTIGIGKLFHKGKSSNKNDVEYSWSEEYYMPFYAERHHLPKEKGKQNMGIVSAKARKEVPLADDDSVMKAKEYMKIARNDKKPFFMGVGFKKPHLPLLCPQEYYDLYTTEAGDQYLPELKWQTPDVKDSVSMGDSKIDGTNLNIIDDKVIRDMRRAYFACVSYVDALVGDLIDELKVQGLDKNTVVVFVADHGYHLGENSHWGKVKNYERATHIPLMIHIPGRTDHGIETRALVEAVDVFPTVVDAAGLRNIMSCPIHSSDIETCTDGKNLLHLIDNPEGRHKKVVYSQIASGGQYMSYTIRSDRYRYMEWAEVMKTPRDDGFWDMYMDWDYESSEHCTEFYDLQTDPEERFNKISDKNYAAIMLKLRKTLHEFVDARYEGPKQFVKPALKNRHKRH